MNQIRRMLCLSVAAILTTAAMAQSNGSNSSYSRFGLGTLNDQSQGFNRGMAGVAQGFQSGRQVNMLNPASYSEIDSLSFIFDVGMGLQMGRIKQGNNSVRAMNTALEYVNAGLRLRKGLGLSFGFVPYSTIGYNFTESTPVTTSWTTGQSIASKVTYYGNGGLHEMYLGLGWKPFAGLSVGANIGYLWGDYDHSMAQTFTEGGTSSSSYNAQNEVWSGNPKTYKLDIGVQYPIRLNSQNRLTLGATYGLGHTIGSKITLLRYTSKGDSIESSAKNAFEMPHTISAGATWQHKGKLTIGADYTMERWQGCKVPMSQTAAGSTNIHIATDQYSNRHRAAIGAEYIQNPEGRSKYAERIHYRIGASYSTPYVKVNNQDGPTEMTLTAGVALPLKTTARSLINVSAEWLRRSPSVSTHIKENYIMLHLGVTFNEQWFTKFKFQ